MKKNDARAFTRSPITAEMQVRLACGVLLEGHALDISMNGVLFATERSLPIGNPVRVSMVLTAGDEQHRIDTEGSVVRITEEGVAIEFTAINEESLEYLRNLVLYNSPNIEKTDQELSSAIGLKRWK